jgi:hypothetical protein
MSRFKIDGYGDGDFNTIDECYGERDGNGWGYGYGTLRGSGRHYAFGTYSSDRNVGDYTGDGWGNGRSACMDTPVFFLLEDGDGWGYEFPITITCSDR